jgi:GTPase SAR1 family protein
MAASAGPSPGASGDLDDLSDLGDVPVFFHVMLLGSSGTGKSSFAARVAGDGAFQVGYAPSDEATSHAPVSVSVAAPDTDADSSGSSSYSSEGERVALFIHDPPSYDHWDASLDALVDRCQGFIVLYSILGEYTLEMVDVAVARIRERPENAEKPIVLAGNKADLGQLRRVVSTEDGQRTAERLKCAAFFETSCKHDAAGVSRTFSALAESIVRTRIPKTKSALKEPMANR